jgi:pimeloyl-ACP methyl ester carboxylesterase
MIDYKKIRLNEGKFYNDIYLDDKAYPIYLDGDGKNQCLCIGIGSLMQKTLSDNFKNIFTVYSSDLYWINKNRLIESYKLTMEKIIDDILSVIKQLSLNKPVLLAHSAYGIVALEAAKKLNANLGGIIMVASAPAWNDDTVSFARKYFDEHASNERKLNDKKRKEKFIQIKKPEESDISVNAYEADSARYWGNYEIDREFLEYLWQGIEADDAIMNHFFSVVLPKNKLEESINHINVPVFLAAGQLDFDSAPLSLWEHASKPKNFTMIDCGEVGHWPNLESPAFFDRELGKWVELNF